MIRRHEKSKHQRRFYQQWYKSCGLNKNCIAYKETEVCVLADSAVDIDLIYKRIQDYRAQIEKYIQRDPGFLTSLKPVPVESTAPSIVKEMAKAAAKADVGPMASVAGAIAQRLAKDLLLRKHKEIIIENGGDIYMVSNSPRIIGVYSGKKKPWRRLKIKIAPKDTPLGICTSSGTIGHSLSLGLADSVVVISKSASLADAVATATANRIKRAKDLNSALKFARSIRGVRAVIIMYKNKLLSWGKLEFVA